MRPQILANAVMNAMKKSRTFDDVFEEVLRLNEDADSGAPALVRSNDELIELWWDRYADTLYHSLVITYGSGARQFAEDAVSEAFLRLHKELQRGGGIENPRAWVWTVARRLMLTEIKRAGSADTKHRAFASLVSTPTPTPDDVLCDQCKRAAYRARVGDALGPRTPVSRIACARSEARRDWKNREARPSPGRGDHRAREPAIGGDGR